MRLAPCLRENKKKNFLKVRRERTSFRFSIANAATQEGLRDHGKKKEGIIKKPSYSGYYFRISEENSLGQGLKKFPKKGKRFFEGLN